MPLWRRNGHNDGSRGTDSQDHGASHTQDSNADDSPGSNGVLPTSAGDDKPMPAPSEQAASDSPGGAAVSSPATIINSQSAGSDGAGTSITSSPDSDRAIVEYHSVTTTRYPDGTEESTERDLKANVPRQDAIPLAKVLANPQPVLDSGPGQDFSTPLLLKPSDRDTPNPGDESSGED